MQLDIKIILRIVSARLHQSVEDSPNFVSCVIFHDKFLLRVETVMRISKFYKLIVSFRLLWDSCCDDVLSSHKVGTC